MNRRKALISGAFAGMALTACIASWAYTTPAAAEEATPEMKSAMLCEVEHVTHYTVNGEAMDETDADYLYRMTVRYGVSKYYPQILAQVYQESGFDPYATNGKDFGYFQIRAAYADNLLELTNLPAETDITTDRFANIECGVAFIADNLRRAGGNYEKAIGMYYNSGDIYADAAYITQVKQWFDTIEQIN